jgi:hypothetical protein
MSSETENIKILGGFFVYRANPSKSTKIAELIGSMESEYEMDIFGQKGEITGMVLIKQYGSRKFFAFSPIDPTNFKIDKLMTYFAGGSEYDNNKTNVFDIGSLSKLIDKLIVQPVSR